MKDIINNIFNRLYLAIMGEWRTICFSKLLEGDYIRVAVGFNSVKQEGVITQKIVTDEDNYVLIDTLNSNGEVIKTFTASQDYCIFEIKR